MKKYAENENLNVMLRVLKSFFLLILKSFPTLERKFNYLWYKLETTKFFRFFFKEKELKVYL